MSRSEKRGEELTTAERSKRKTFLQEELLIQNWKKKSELNQIRWVEWGRRKTP